MLSKNNRRVEFYEEPNILKKLKITKTYFDDKLLAYWVLKLTNTW